MKTKKLRPFLKWAGGKEKELNYILPLIPNKIDRYFEPFVGGGAVYFSLNCKNNFINDKSGELIQLYNMIKKQDKEFFYKLELIYNNFVFKWNAVFLFLAIYKTFND